MNSNDKIAVNPVLSPSNGPDIDNKHEFLKSTPVRRPLACLKSNQLVQLQSQSTIPRNKLSKFFLIQEENDDENVNSNINSSSNYPVNRMFTPPSTWMKHYKNNYSSNTPCKSTTPITTQSPAPVTRAFTPSSNTCSSTNDLPGHPETPQQAPLYNPFQNCIEGLQVPTVSPSLFREVVSPSKKVEHSFSWSLEQMARLHPAFTEVSPRHLLEYTTDPEYENQAQEAIEKFFNNYSVVPSPWTDNSSKAAITSPNSCNASPFLCIPGPASKATVWCQTDLTFPPVLPAEVEEVLARFSTFNQDQSCQNNDEMDEASVMNNTALRRKLHFGTEDGFNSSQMTTGNCSSSNSSGATVSCDDSAPPPHYPSDPPDEDELDLPWCGSMIHLSSDEKRFITSPGTINPQDQENSSFKLTTAELSPIKPQGLFSPVASSPQLSPIAFRFTSSTHEKDEDSANLSMEKDMSQNSATSDSQEDMSSSSQIFNYDKNHCSQESGDSAEQMRYYSACNSLNKVTPVRHFGYFNQNCRQGALKLKCKKRLESSATDIFSNDVDDTTITSPISTVNSGASRHSPLYGTPSSTQFSSSPIKSSCTDACNNENSNTPSKLSTSPPVSPIPWRSGPAVSRSLPLMEDNDGDVDINYEESDVTMGIPLTINMDTDSQPFIEASSYYFEDGSSQDTGYHTGYSSTLGPLSQSTYTGDTISNVKLFNEKLNSGSETHADNIAN